VPQIPVEGYSVIFHFSFAFIFTYLNLNYKLYNKKVKGETPVSGLYILEIHYKRCGKIEEAASFSASKISFAIMTPILEKNFRRSSRSWFDKNCCISVRNLRKIFISGK